MLRSLSLFFAAVALLAPLRADTLVLQDGTEFQGELISQTPEEVQFRVQISENLRERRTFQRADILRLVETQPDQIEAEAIYQLHPAPELLPAAEYRARIERAEAFLSDYPDSSRRDRVEHIRDELQEDLQRVARGELFLGGDWLGEVQRANRQPEVVATRKLKTIQEGMESENWAEVIGVFDDLDQHYRGTSAFMAARDAALGDPGQKGFLAAYRSVLSRALRDIDLDDESPDPDAKRIDNLRSEQKRDGRLWLAINPRDPKQLRETIDLTRSEETRLADEDESVLRAQIRAVNQVYDLLDRGNREAASAQIEELSEAGVGSRVIEILTARVPEVTSAVGDNQGAEDPSAEEPGDEADGETIPAVTPEPEESAEENPAPVDETQASEEPVDEEAALEDSDTTEAVEDTPASASSSKIAPEKGLNLPLIIGAVIGALVVLLVVLIVLQKRGAGGKGEE